MRVTSACEYGRGSVPVRVRSALAVLVAFAVAPPTAHAALVHSWPGEGSAVDVVADPDGTHSGGFTGDGLVGQAFTYGGLASSDLGNVWNHGPGDFTIAFALRTTQTDGSVAVLAKRPQCSADAPFWNFRSGGGGIGFETYDTPAGLGGTNRGVSMAGTLNDGYWHTVTVTRAGTTVTGYIDGEQRATRSDGGANVTNAEPIRVGTSVCVGADGTVPLVGAVDEIRIGDAVDANLLPPPPMVGTTPPAVTGDGAVGATLTCSEGVWRYPVTVGLSRQWLRDGQPIDGATGPTYVVSAADAGATITCRVTAANQSGPAASDSAGVPVPPAPPVPPPASPPASPPPAGPASPRPPAPVAITTIATLPSAKACVSRRRFPIRLRGVKANRIVRAQIKLNGRQIRNLTGRALGLPVDLRGLPKGRFTVEIVTTDRAGRKLVGKRTYRTCVPRRR